MAELIPKLSGTDEVKLITAYQAKGKGVITVEDSKGGIVVSKDAAELLSWIVKTPGDINVVYDAMAFYQPIFTLLPYSVVSLLTDGKAAHWQGFRFWFGKTRHGRVIGITYLEPLGGNQYKKYEKEIYELKQYFDEAPASLKQTVEMAEELLAALSQMGLSTGKLISAGAIYKENILDKMAIPSLLNMKDESEDTHELAMNNISEWTSTYISKPPDSHDVYSYDLTAAYPSALAELPNLHYISEYERLTEIPNGVYYGVMYGVVHNKTLISPLVNPYLGRSNVGYWQGTMNLWEYASAYQWGYADFKMEYGYFIRLGKFHRLFDYSMKKLYQYRNGDSELKNNLSKAMAVYIIGKFQEQRGDYYGDLYNPIYADMVTSMIRVKVADFIYRNKLQNDVVSVNVDGVKSLKKLDIPTTRQFGEWRYNAKS